MDEIRTYKREGATLNADVTVDGVTRSPTPESNVLENAIPGVRMTLKGITTSPVSVNTTQPAVDSDAIAKKITALVDAYNAVVTATRSELTEKRVPTATTTSDLQKGQLFGDTGMISMLNQLKSTMTQALTGLGLTGLADLGIGVPKAGASTEDAQARASSRSTRTSSRPRSPPTTRRSASCSPARAPPRACPALISDYVGSQTGTNGMLTGRMKSDDNRLKGFTDQITQAQHAHGDRAEAPEGAVRRHGNGAEQLADPAGLAHQPDRLAGS